MGKRSMKAEERVAIPITKKAKHDTSIEEIGNEPEEESYEDQLRNRNAISVPMASKKKSKKLYKLIRKASASKTNLTCGLKNVQRSLRHNKTGVMILAADIHPIEIYAHIPIMCERQKIPYIFVPSRRDMGKAMGFKRSVMIVFVHQDDSYEGTFEECKNFIKEAFKAEVLPLK